MYCKYCGTKIPENAKFCPKCGAPCSAQPVGGALQEEQTSGAAQQEQTSGAAQQEEQTSGPQQEQTSGQQQEQTSGQQQQQQAGGAQQQQPPYSEPAHYHKPDDYVSMGAFVLLLLFTFGIYYLINYYKMTKFANNATRVDDTADIKSPAGQLLLCMFIPFYNIYWYYQTTKRIDSLYRSSLGEESDLATTSLVLSIFGLGSIAQILMRSRINYAVGGATGMSPKSTGMGTCRQCGTQFTDDKVACPNCGAPYRKPAYRHIWFPILCAVLALILAFVMLVVWAVKSVDDDTDYSGDDTTSLQDDTDTGSEDSDFNAAAVAGSLQETNYLYADSVGSGWYVAKIKNTSKYTIDISCQATFYNNDGTEAGNGSQEVYDIPAGQTAVLTFVNDTTFSSQKHTVTVSEDTMYEPVSQNISFSNIQKGSDKVTFSASNKGGQDVQYADVTALFFKGDTLVYCGTTYVDDSEGVLKGGKTQDGSIYCSEEYDTVELYAGGTSSY